MGATAMSSTVSNARPTAVSTIKREGSPARWVSTLLRIRRRDSTADVMASAPPSLISTAAQSPRGRGALVASKRRDQRQHLQRIVGRFAAPDIERRDVPQIVVHPVAGVGWIHGDEARKPAPAHQFGHPVQISLWPVGPAWPTAQQPAQGDPPGRVPRLEQRHRAHPQPRGPPRAAVVGDGVGEYWQQSRAAQPTSVGVEPGWSESHSSQRVTERLQIGPAAGAAPHSNTASAHHPSCMSMPTSQR